MRFVFGCLLVVFLITPGGVLAQTSSFGSLDDPREQAETAWWRRENRLDVMGGLSLIGPQWRGATAIRASLVGPRLALQLNGTLRGGIYGDYRNDRDELYDALRLLEFVRYTPVRKRPGYNQYLRVGAIRNARLGTGHLVDFFSTMTAWDARTIGVEGFYQTPSFNLAVFSDDVLMDGLVGGRLGLHPFRSQRGTRLRTLELGLSLVTDQRIDQETFTGYNVDLSVDAFRTDPLAFTPFMSAAWYENQGHSFGLGAHVGTMPGGDFGSFQFTLAAFFNSNHFKPGYIGTFYGISNERARVLNAERFDPDRGTEQYADLPLSRLGSDLSIWTELRVLIYEQVEVLYAFRREYASTNLSTMHVRLFFETPGGTRLDLGLDRGDLGGFLTSFNDLGDLTALVLNAEAQVRYPFWIFVQSRYTFEQRDDATDGTQRFLVQRRFEPMAGLRLTF
ncbi:MAG: hypothetical protein RhofKO_15410 [Rhodothermales bacterium]